MLMDNLQFDKYICEKYPTLFRERNLPMSQTCMCWGIDCGPGWNKLLEELCESLYLIETLTGVEIIVRQVKEKRGTLRFYYHPDIQNIKSDVQSEIVLHTVQTIVSYAEYQSEYICEVCGNFGKTKSHLGWRVTLCNTHHEEREKANMELRSAAHRHPKELPK